MATVAVTIPVNGAIVSVPRVTVVGTVPTGVPGVRVAGDRVRVHNGGFSVSVRLHHGRNRIAILAAAPGFVATRSWVTVRYQSDGANAGPSLADRVNGVCTAVNNRFVIASASPGTPTVRAELHQQVLTIDHEVARFQSFTASAAERPAYSRFLALETTMSTRFKAVVAAPTRPGLKSLVTMIKTRDRLGYELGFVDCVSLLGQLKQLGG